MANDDVQAILDSANNGDWQKAEDFDGQVLTIIDYEVETGGHGEFLIIDVVTEDGDEAKLSNGGKLAAQVQALRAADKLPIELRVVGSKTRYGTMSYFFELAEDE